MPLKSDFNNSNNLSSFTTYKKYFNTDILGLMDMCKINLSEQDVLKTKNRNKRNRQIGKDECVAIICKMQSKINIESDSQWNKFVIHLECN